MSNLYLKNMDKALEFLDLVGGERDRKRMRVQCF